MLCLATRGVLGGGEADENCTSGEITVQGPIDPSDQRIAPEEAHDAIRDSFQGASSFPDVPQDQHALFVRALLDGRTQPKRIGEIDRVPIGVAVQIEPSRQPDRIFLGELSRRWIVRPDPVVQMIAPSAGGIGGPASPRC